MTLYCQYLVSARVRDVVTLFRFSYSTVHTSGFDNVRMGCKHPETFQLTLHFVHEASSSGMWYPSWNETPFWQHLINLRDTSHPTHTPYKQKKTLNATKIKLGILIHDILLRIRS